MSRVADPARRAALALLEVGPDYAWRVIGCMLI
jgi:hypothetical protein